MVTGRLENWEYDLLRSVYWGLIYDDIHKRFRDSTYIHTSHCLDKNAKEGDIVKTLNSTYLLGKPAVQKEMQNA